jgi:hypothetical protein
LVRRISIARSRSAIAASAWPSAGPREHGERRGEHGERASSLRPTSTGTCASRWCADGPLDLALGQRAVAELDRVARLDERLVGVPEQREVARPESTGRAS